MFDLKLDELVTISIALDEKLDFYLAQRNTANTDEYREFLDIRISDVVRIQEKLGFSL